MMPQTSAHRHVNWFTWVLAAWALVFAITSVRVLVSKPRTHSDYLTFANTARNWTAGKGIYRQVGDDGYYDDFRYSPAVAVALVPFSVLPDKVGNVLWRLVNLAAFLAALAWWGRKVAISEAGPASLALLFLLVLPLSIGNINNGQSNPLVLGLMLAAVAGVTEQRWNLVSVFLALAVLFKIYPIAIALLLIAIYPRQLTARFALALAVGLVLPFLFQRPAYVLDQYQIWGHYLVNEDRQMMPLAATYRDVRLLFRSLSMPLDAKVYLMIQLATAAGAAVICLAGNLCHWSETRLLALLTGLSCCWMTVFGVATESCTYMLVAPTGVWALMQARLERRSLVVRGLLAGSFGLFLIAQMANWFKGGADFHALGVQPLAGLLLIGGLLAAEVGGQKSETRSQNSEVGSQRSEESQAA
jgi:hypothetical protein